ncbi:MAG TPA: polymer-forming cytoskeletal protein [Phycisphaerales bacterium]|nr:polymer-forming cytoskeletal protein [Phycisphaerales bacterium]
MAEPTNTTVIGADTHIKGEMRFESTARILGTFEGTIEAKGELQVASGASCKAAVEAIKVLVDGEVDGNLTAKERVELTAKAKMKGDLVAARLVVADGASFTGHVKVGPDAHGSGTAHSFAEHKPMGYAAPGANKGPDNQLKK